jgi:hypothetical protein
MALGILVADHNEEGRTAKLADRIAPTVEHGAGDALASIEGRARSGC